MRHHVDLSRSRIISVTVPKPSPRMPPPLTRLLPRIGSKARRKVRRSLLGVGERPKEGCLAGGLNFVWDPDRYGGTGEITVGVRFRGTLKSAPVSGSTAAMQFTKTESPTLSNYAGYKAAPFQACQLMTGTWVVTAEVISGPLPKRTIPCTAIIPGSVEFNYEDSTCLP